MSKATGLTDRVMAAIAEPHGNVDALPKMREAMDAMMDELRDACNKVDLDTLDLDAWWAAMDVG